MIRVSPFNTPTAARIWWRVSEQAETEDNQCGYMWWIGELNGQPAFTASGSYYQRIYCFPGSRLVVVVTAAADVSSPDTLHESLDPMLRKVIFDPLI